ncbi:transporter [Streptomyces sp. NPDC058385]|uniref:transporter n=1 Tax=Streptomyces sp. NPDC058385 TaxID=3346473 RepID=UPI003662B4A3
MKEMLFTLADFWMIFAGFSYGWKFIRRYGNYLLGLEWMIVATSGSNFLVWSLLGGDPDSVLYDIAYFFDAFSRSVGITLILVMGLMRVTRRYKPTLTVDIGVFALAIVAGLYLQQFRGHELHVGPATFYVVVNAFTTLFLAYFSWRLWKIRAKGLAIGAALATAAGTAIALIYDFFPIPGDDAYRTTHYILALTTWGFQLFVYFISYRALHNHNVATGAEPAANEPSVARA